MAKGRTEIAELGEFGLIDRLTAKFSKTALRLREAVTSHGQESPIRIRTVNLV
jgi:hypothetical protein